MVQDCADVLAGKSFYSPYGAKTAAVNTDALCYYVSGCVDSWIEENKAEAWGDAIVTKPVPVAQMHAWKAEHKDAFIAAFAE